MMGLVVVVRNLFANEQRVVIRTSELNAVAVRPIAFAKLNVDFHPWRTFSTVIQHRVRSAFDLRVPGKILSNNLFQKMEYADEIGLARTISADEDIQGPQREFLLANGFEVGDLQSLEYAHSGIVSSKLIGPLQISTTSERF